MTVVPMRKLARFGMPLSVTYSVLVPHILQVPFEVSPVEGTSWLDESLYIPACACVGTES